MADDEQTFDDDESGDQEVRNPRIRDLIHKGEKASKDLRERDAELAAVKAKLAFTEAGIPAEGMGEYFRKGYDGEMTPEAIREAATKAGILQATAANASDAELDDLRRLQQTAAGGAPPANTSAAFWNDVRAKAAALPWSDKPEQAGRDFVALFHDAPAELGIQFGEPQ